MNWIDLGKRKKDKARERSIIMNWFRRKWYAWIARIAVKKIEKKIKRNQEGINLFLELKDPGDIEKLDALARRGMKNINVLMQNKSNYEEFLIDLKNDNVAGKPRFWRRDGDGRKKYMHFP